MKSKPLLFAGIILLLAAIGLYWSRKTNPFSSPEQESRKELPIIIVGATPPGALDLGSRIIIEKGWDEESGFQLELRPIFPEGAVPALTEGTVDIISIAPLTAVGLVNQKKPIVFLANGIKVNCPFFVNQDSQAKDWRDLKGKKLGTGSEAGPSFTTFKVIMKAKEGIDVDEYFIVLHSSFAELIPRLVRGEIDGAYGRCSEVGIAQATEEAKFKVIGNINDIIYKDGDFKELMTDGVVANTEWVATNGDLAKKFQETLYKAYDYIRTHPEVYDDPEIRKAYAIEDASPETINNIKGLVEFFYTFVSWSELIDSQYRFFEIAKEEGFLEELPPKTDLFFLPSQ